MQSTGTFSNQFIYSALMGSSLFLTTYKSTHYNFDLLDYIFYSIFAKRLIRYGVKGFQVRVRLD